MRDGWAAIFFCYTHTVGLFYTGKGDAGKSAIGRKKISKAALVVGALGALDELNSLIGAVRHERISPENKALLDQVQEHLFIIQANVAGALFGSGRGVPKMARTTIIEMEKRIDAFEERVKPARKFIIPGGTPGSAWLDVLRACARNVERIVVSFSETRRLAPEVLAYMNRLSSLFFAMARMEAKRSGIKERHPRYQ